MEFRWIALLALWTLLSGPIFSSPPRSTTPVVERPASNPVPSTAPSR